MTMQITPLRIGIIGAGFSGISLAANLQRKTHIPLEIFIFDKTGNFGVGNAYNTPFPFHLLNVRAKEMSAFPDKPNHFVDWLRSNQDAQKLLSSDEPLAEQFVPRFLYRQYLQTLLSSLKKSTNIKLHFKASEVIDVVPSSKDVSLILHHGKSTTVDKVVFATGNNPPVPFPFPISGETRLLTNPWDYAAIRHIPLNDAVLIVGTGLSMIDTVLTLDNQKHQGPIYAISRHGLLPLAHAQTFAAFNVPFPDFPVNLRGLIQYVRTLIRNHNKAGGDWRDVLHALREHVPALWQRMPISDKKRFLRHLSTYWNIHRHQVNPSIADLLNNAIERSQLKIFKGRIQEIRDGMATLMLSHQNETFKLPVQWLVNCMGPILGVNKEDPLWQALLTKGLICVDELSLGLEISPHGALKNKSGNISLLFYTLGPPTRGFFWEVTAVPEIRKQSLALAKFLLKD